MEVLRGVGKLTHSLLHPVITIGNFDGVHLGHQKIIQLAIEKAKARGGQCVVYTFAPHPQVALRPDSPEKLLLTYEEKLEILGSLGPDLIIEEPFTFEFSKIEPEQFFKQYMMERLNPEVIVVGYDFAFGKGRQGQLPVLETFCKEASVELHIVPQLRNNEIISSTQIRQHLLSGHIESANQLLGREFFYKGTVVQGDGRGKKIGFPTANLQFQKKLMLPSGVYATWAVIEGKVYPSVTNIGVRPTFQSNHLDHPIQVETHLFNQNMNLYGLPFEVRFLSKLRDEKKFSGIEALKIQIAQDIKQAQDIIKMSN